MDAVDNKGRQFDPSIHVTDSDGKPKFNSNGTIKIMTGLQQKAHKPEASRTHTTHGKRNRKRGQLGVQLRLDAEKRPGFVRRWFNDIEGRVNRFMTQDDWTPVKDQSGSVIRRPAGRGYDTVLMEIPEDWYEENQAENRKRIVDPADMKENQLEEGDYLPGGKKRALTGESPLR